jgi:predicted TIM-barrel fold metal-dependent hydrolase
MQTAPQFQERTAARATRRVVAVEEHFWTERLRAASPVEHMPAHWVQHLSDVGAGRLQAMDDAGIDIQILSHAPTPTPLSVELARETNDELGRIVRTHPDRFRAFAMLPMGDPEAAASELQRAVVDLGFCGAMIHGLTDGRFTDDKRFWLVYERAEQLGVPIYLHPSDPHPAVAEAYYKGYRGLAQAGWGFTAETATHAIRLILSGVFDAMPNLTVILGHLGESLPFSLRRCDAALSRESGLKRPFIDYFRNNFYITTSGNFSAAALLCSIMEMSADRILFAVDWPFASNKEAMDFIMMAAISPIDRAKILSGNSAKLLRI